MATAAPEPRAAPRQTPRRARRGQSRPAALAPLSQSVRSVRSQLTVAPDLVSRVAPVDIALSTPAEAPPVSAGRSPRRQRLIAFGTDSLPLYWRFAFLQTN